MPIVTVTTNVAGDSIPVFFQATLTNMTSTALQKPRQVVMVELRAGADLMMGGDRNPCVFATVQCIGRLSPQLNLSLATSMEDCFIRHLKVPRDKILIRFIPVPAQFCSYNGALHDVSIETNDDLTTNYDDVTESANTTQKQ